MRKMKKSNLPHDLVIQILVRLPAKSILRFKCVCKIWYALFQNPNFISDHLEFHKTNSITNHSIIVSRQNQLTNSYVSSIVYDSETSSELDLPTVIQDMPVIEDVDGRSNIQMVGSLNGVLCISFGPNICLWNPITRELNVLPPPLHGLISRPAVGLGLKNNDLNVVRLMLFEDYDEDDEEQLLWIVQVYSVMKGSWSNIQSHLSSNMTSVLSSTTYLNGSFHWSAYLNDTNMILSFDFVNEVFQDIALPGDVDELQQLVVVNDRIGIICEIDNSPVSRYFDIWVMMEYGVQDSWTPMYNLEIHPLRGDYAPIGFLRNADLFSQHENGFLYCCDLETSKVEVFQISGVPYTMEFVNYMETLVSPKGGNCVEESCSP